VPLDRLGENPQNQFSGPATINASSTISNPLVGTHTQATSRHMAAVGHRMKSAIPIDRLNAKIMTSTYIARS
jgi:hypothetical protein